MSGPKCGEWSVQANLERERRIVAELRDNIIRVQSDLKAVQVKWRAAREEFGHDFPEPPVESVERVSADADSDTLRAVLHRLRNKEASWREDLAEAESLHRIKALLAATAVSREVGTTSKAATDEDVKRKVKVRQEKLAALLSSLDPMLPDQDRSAIEAIGREATKKVETSKFESIFLDLRRHVQASNQKQADREKASARAQTLLDRLTGLEGPEIRRISQELMRVQQGVARFRPSLEAEVAAIAAAATAEEDQRYVSRVLAEELEKLGYSTSSGMETVLVQGGELQFRKAELREYAVNFSVNRESGQFDVHLTRDADPHDTASSERRLRDRSMEELWCGDLASVLSTAAERGILARVTRREKPGAVPVAIRRETDGRRGSRTSRSRSMGLPRSE
jgi:hypothetical protein